MKDVLRLAKSSHVIQHYVTSTVEMASLNNKEPTIHIYHTRGHVIFVTGCTFYPVFLHKKHFSFVVSFFSFITCEQKTVPPSIPPFIPDHPFSLLHQLS
jgi:hydrogenase maturation factor